MLRLLIYRMNKFSLGVAVCVLCKKTDRIQTDAQLGTALRNACTKWAKETENGRGAYEYAGDDFNFGDLSSYADDESLKPYLAAEGIEDFDMFGFDDCDNLTYDTSLMEIIDEDE